MNDLTAFEFCKKFGACANGKKWAYGLTEKRSKAKMSELWESYRKNPTVEHFNYFQWAINCNGVFSGNILRKMACRFVRETPLPDGRKVWDLLTDERSRNAVFVAERFAEGNATQEELASAVEAARAAAMEAARASAVEAARAAAWAAARASAVEAAWASARAAAVEAQLQIIFEYGNPWA